MAFDLQKFKEAYDALAKQHALPSFVALNNDFELDKISQESMTVLRAVRKALMEKVFNLLNFLEMLLNPVNAPRTYLPYIKAMTNDERKAIDVLFGTFGKLTLRALPLEVEYSEKREAGMIKDIAKTWSDAKQELAHLMGRVGAPTDNGAKKERSYYG